MEYWSVGYEVLDCSIPPFHCSITPFFLHWAKLRQCHLRCDIFEDQPHGHPYSHILPPTLDHVADHRYLIFSAIEGDMRDDVGYVILKSRNRHVMHDHERIHGAGFAELGPVEFPRIAMRAESLGRPTKFPAIVAALCRKLVRFTSVPEWLGIKIRYR